MKRSVFRISLRLVSPFMFEGTVNTRFGVDNATIRDIKGRPLIPATQIKGVLKDCCDVLARRSNLLKPDDVKWLFGEVSLDKSNADLTRTGYNEPRRGALIFTDLVAGDKLGHGETTRIAIDDATGTAKGGALQVIELVASFGAEVGFAGEVVLRGADDEFTARVEKALAAALALIPSIGANKSAGFGEVAGSELRKIDAPLSAKTVPANATRVAVEIGFDRPFVVDADRVAENIFEGSTIVPGAALKGAVAERLRRDGGDPENDPALSRALADLIVSHAFPIRDGKKADRAIPRSLVRSRQEEMHDTSGGKEYVWIADAIGFGFGRAPVRKDGNPVQFVASAKDRDMPPLRTLLGLPKSDLRRAPRTHVEISNASGTATEGQLYALIGIEPEEYKWRFEIDAGRISEPQRTRLLTAFATDVEGIGRTNATARIAGVSIAGPAALPPGDEFVVTLETPALMFLLPNGQKSFTLYSSYFSSAFPGAKLLNFFATQRMAGGHVGTRRRPFGRTYYPFILTEAGSVFRLDVTDGGRAELTNALARGLPVCSGPDGRDLTWRDCPYVPENGYGAIRLGTTDAKVENDEIDAVGGIDV